MTSDIQTELSVCVVLPNGEFKTLCALVDFGCEALALANPNSFGDKISEKNKCFNGNSWYKHIMRCLCRGGDESIDVKIPFTVVTDGNVSPSRVAQYGVSPSIVPD